MVESTSGICPLAPSSPPRNIGNPECKSDNHLTVVKIIKRYHPSIENRNKIYTKKENFDVPAATN